MRRNTDPSDIMFKSQYQDDMIVVVMMMTSFSSNLGLRNEYKFWLCYIFSRVYYQENEFHPLHLSELPWAGSMDPRAYSMHFCTGRYQLGQKTTIVDCVSNRPLPCDLYSASFAGP